MQTRSGCTKMRCGSTCDEALNEQRGRARSIMPSTGSDPKSDSNGRISLYQVCRTCAEFYLSYSSPRRVLGGPDMKMVYTAQNVIPCDILTSMLQAEGIWCTINNPRGSFTVGEGWPLPSSLAWAWPEVWVRDEDFETAADITSQFRKNRSE